LGPETSHSKSRERETLTYRTKQREKMDNLGKTILIHKERRTMEIQRKIPGSGPNSIRSLGI